MEQIDTQPPNLLLSGHFHEPPYSRGWHDRVGPTLCMNAGQWAPSPFYVSQEAPNHIVIDTLKKTATWHAFQHETGEPLSPETVPF
jgi:hypothetical protein